MEEIYILTAKLIYSNLLRILNDSSSRAHQFLEAVKPFFAVQFARRVVFELDNYKLRVLMARLKSSRLSAHWYSLLLKHMAVSMTDDSASISFIFEDWRRLLVRFQLDADRSFPDWIPLLNNLVAYEVRSPSDLAAPPKADFFAIAADSPHRDELLKLWQAASHSCSREGVAAAGPAGVWATNASELASSLRHRDIGDTFVPAHATLLSAISGCPPASSRPGPQPRFAYYSTLSRIRLL